MRTLPLKLKQLQILFRRTVLGSTEEKDKEKLTRGFHGELEFDKVLGEFVRGLDVYHLKDYRFKIDAKGEELKVASGLSEVQIDNVLVAGDQVYTFEVKNFNFDLVYGSKSWHFTGGKEYKDLSMQVNRQRTSLDFLLRRGGFNYNITSHLVFVNPRQTIYNMPDLENLLVPSNMHWRLGNICVSNRFEHNRVVKYLNSRRLAKSMYDLPVNVNFEELRCGVFCGGCDSGEELERVNRYKYLCNQCDRSFTTLEVVKILIDEMRTLNNTWPVTPARLSKLSGGAISSGCIRNYRKQGYITLTNEL